jgi:hypothetical protein
MPASKVNPVNPSPEQAEQADRMDWPLVRGAALISCALPVALIVLGLLPIPVDFPEDSPWAGYLLATAYLLFYFVLPPVVVARKVQSDHFIYGVAVAVVGSAYIFPVEMIGLLFMPNAHGGGDLSIVMLVVGVLLSPVAGLVSVVTAKLTHRRSSTNHGVGNESR